MIEINNLTTSSVDEDFLKRVAEKVLKGENKSGAEASIALVGQGRMRKLNKKYQGKNRVTDVLAFPGRATKKGKYASFLEKIEGLGEIVICLREVRKNAKKFGSTFEKELARILIHGLLHLLGYDHKKDKEEADALKKREEYYLAQI